MTVSSLILVACLFIADQFSKHFVPGRWLNTRVFLTELAVSPLTAIVAAGVTLLSFALSLAVRNKIARLGFLLIGGGGLSNLVDQLFYGGVWDPFKGAGLSFNVADGMVIIGIGLVLAVVVDRQGIRKLLSRLAP